MMQGQTKIKYPYHIYSSTSAVEAWEYTETKADPYIYQKTRFHIS